MTGPDTSAPSKPGRWCAAHGKTHPLTWFEGDRASCRRAEKAAQRTAEEARAAGMRAFAEQSAPTPEEMPGAPPWAGIDGASLMQRLSEETRWQWYALFDRDPEWCRKAFAEFAAAAHAAEH
jgi:hypothetical protein